MVTVLLNRTKDVIETKCNISMDTHTDNNYEQIREIPRLDSALCNGEHLLCGIHCFKSWGTDQRAVDCGGVGLYPI